ncbi:Testis-expressed protein 30 [Durusdinium trenchii]|uniref:Testis-expressed protein 30 n=1 Tax=Durusdinium trenchii TaxID=1381693 RepID=A0ABP0PLY3_9DINO
MVLRRPASQARRPASSTKSPIFLCAPGAGGGRSRQALLGRFGSVKHIKLSGALNLTEQHETRILEELLKQMKAASKANQSGRPIYLVGHSFGARAAVHLFARTDVRKQLPHNVQGIIAFGYPLLHPTQHRERKILELPASTRVLFLSGTRDPFMGDFKLLKGTLKKAKCKHTLVKVEGGDHSLKCSKGQEDSVVSTIQEAIEAFV